MTLLEVLGIATVLPVATSDGVGSLHFIGACFALFGVATLPVALAFAVVERVARPRLPASEEALAVLLALPLATMALRWLVTTVKPHRGDFAEQLDLLRTTGLLGISLALLLALRFVFVPALRRLQAYFPRLVQPRRLTAALLFLLAFFVHFVNYRVFLALHLRELSALASLTSLCCMLCGARASGAEVDRKTTKVLFLALGVAVSLGPLVTLRDRHARFLLFSHAAAAGPLAEAWWWLSDFDRDGAAAAWAGGDDCAPFDRTRSPAEREVPGDDLDQDCSGGDAPPLPVAPTPALPTQCSPPQRPSVVLITLDAVRADRVSPGLTPHLAQLAARSFVFSRAYAPATVTGASVASLFSGLPFSDLSSSNPLLGGERLAWPTTFIERFRRAGYQTVAFNFLKHPDEVMVGFEDNNPFWVDPHARGLTHHFTSANLTNGVLDFVSRRRKEPFFLWVHFTDAHAPYLDPKQGKDTVEKLSPYEREVAYTDFHVGRLLVGLEQLGVFNGAVLALTSDHGEDLGRRGKEGHGPDAFEDTIHVPMIVHVPGCAPRLFTDRVNTLRLGATLGVLAGVDVPGPSLFQAGEEAWMPVVSEATLLNKGAFKRAVLNREKKLIVDVRSGGRLLFDLTRDPGETTDIYAANAEARSELESAYQRWLDRPGRR